MNVVSPGGDRLIPSSVSHRTQRVAHALHNAVIVKRAPRQALAVA
ncbi:hypothetical protein [Burkholderia cepacia]|nr:hypothetical protein [Burkholderia cepacia]